MTPADERPLAWDDPIVSEVRKVREALLAAAGYDLERLCERLRQEQSESGRRIVTHPPRRPSHRDGEAA